MEQQRTQRPPSVPTTPQPWPRQRRSTEWNSIGWVARLGSDRSRGLDQATAAAVLAEHGPNELPPAPSRPLLLRVLDQLREPMALLLIGAAIVSRVALGETVEAIAIVVIVVVNAVIALVQEGRSRRALDALEQMQQVHATVVRDGVVQLVDARELVPGDLVRLEAGDRVPADLRLSAATVLQADESMLTGESAPVDKDPSASPPTEDAGAYERPTMVFSGTFATRGTGMGIVVATGPDSALGKIAAQLSEPSPPTPLQRELATLTARLGVAAVVIALGVMALTLLRTGLTAEGLQESFLSAVALAVAAVPEGLATVTLVGLAIGVRRMAVQQAIIRSLPAVEALGSATVIVTDKTGTITLNRMTLAEVAGGDGQFVPLAEATMPLAESILQVGVLCNDATLEPNRGDPLEIALLEAAGASEVQRLRDRYPRAAVAPFDAARRRMTTVHLADDHHLLPTKGAAEVIFEASTELRTPGGGVEPLTDDRKSELLAAADRAAAGGLRVLALAERRLEEPPTDVTDAEHDLVLVGLVGLIDPVRPEARAAVQEARTAGIRILMATGDHRATASAIAEDAGLAGGTTLTGAELRRDGLPDDPAAVTVYARLDPDQKVVLVEGLQAHGDVVAMTGDGVNDAPALHRADIGVALGARGSDVAREAADMVISDDNLATIVSAVREGRGVYDNIRKVVDYLVAGNFSEIVVVVGALLLFPELGVPLLPLQLLWVNLLTDGLPALALGVDRHDPGLMRQPPRSPDTQLLDRARIRQLAARGAAIAAACLATVPVTLFVWEQDVEQARTVVLTTLVVTHLLYALVARMPAHRTPHVRPGSRRSSAWLTAALASGLALHALIVLWAPARTVFGTAALDARDWLLVAVAALFGLAGTVLVRALGLSEARPPLRSTSWSP